MIKNTTVIKRMAKASWKPIAFGVGSAVVISVLSLVAELYMGFDYDTTYWGLYAALILAFFIKSAYDITISNIKFEQEQLLRDLGKKND